MTANDILRDLIITELLSRETLSQIYEHKAKAGNVANGTPTLDGDGELAQGNMPTNEQQQQQQIQNNTRQRRIRRQYIHQRLKQYLNDARGEIERNKVEAQQYASNQQHETSQKIANPEKEKKIRNVAKKLLDIKELKVRQIEGEVLDLNQLNKIAMESKVSEELKALKLSS